MELFLNIGLAWISVLAAIVLLLAYFTRKSIVIFPSVRKTFVKLNKALRKHHKLIGIILIVTALVHGIFSSEKVLSINLGTVSWILSILLGINWMLRKKLIKFKGWMFYHRILVIVFSLSIVIHVVDVGGIQVFNLLKKAPVTSSEILNETIAETAQQSETPEAITSGGKRHRGTAISTQPTVEPSQATAPESSYESMYEDGTYMGEATGYRPGLVVSVEISDNEII
ncbi:MAG: hypothetical protein JW903_06490, partial [Clostridia bacterium]|nr:hypothetical protein [Clostridia bacterium]